MNTQLHGYKFEPGRVEALRAAALQARSEYMADLVVRGWRSLQRAGLWLARQFRATPGRRPGQSFYRCPDCA